MKKPAAGSPGVLFRARSGAMMTKSGSIVNNTADFCAGFTGNADVVSLDVMQVPPLAVSFLLPDNPRHRVKQNSLIRGQEKSLMDDWGRERNGSG